MYDLHAQKGDLCIQPIYWKKRQLEGIRNDKNKDIIYKAIPPEPKDGRWTGYYIEVVFPGEETDVSFDIVKNEFTTTTSGYTWPQTLPFEACNSQIGDGCGRNLV